MLLRWLLEAIQRKARKMIKLDVENYCQECGDFEPGKETVILYAGDEPISRTTTVYCKYRGRCASIAKYLEEKAESKED